MAHSFASRLIDLVARAAARASAPTWSMPGSPCRTCLSAASEDGRVAMPDGSAFSVPRVFGGPSATACERDSMFTSRRYLAAPDPASSGPAAQAPGQLPRPAAARAREPPLCAANPPPQDPSAARPTHPWGRCTTDDLDMLSRFSGHASLTQQGFPHTGAEGGADGSAGGDPLTPGHHRVRSGSG
jgi:hypothetical protein